METITIEAKSVAAFTQALAALPHETRADVTATEAGTPWATVDISPMTDTTRAAFPNYLTGGRGDAERRTGHMGVVLYGGRTDNSHALGVVVNRARKMARA